MCLTETHMRILEKRKHTKITWACSLLGQLINTSATILANFSSSFYGCRSLIQDVLHKNEAPTFSYTNL